MKIKGRHIIFESDLLNYNQREEIFMKNCMKKIICFGLVFMILFIAQGYITTYALENNKVSNSIAITNQPTAVTGKIGDAAEFRVGASGTNLKYQWQYVLKGQNNWVNFTNGNACTMKKVLNETYDDLKVRVVITDGNGNSVTSDTVTVTLKKAPVITSQPTAVTGKIGDAAEFRVSIVGAPWSRVVVPLMKYFRLRKRIGVTRTSSMSAISIMLLCPLRTDGSGKRLIICPMPI